MELPSTNVRPPLNIHWRPVLKFGITGTFDCSYLPGKKERLLVFAGTLTPDLKPQYELMLAHGFRRSGEQIYRPNCPACACCQPIRIPVSKFQPSKSQKRVRSKNKHLQTRISRVHRSEYYDLYENYINTRHSDGGMYPASLDQYQQFLFSTWMEPMFIEFYDDNQLIMVAIVDEVKNALSALYTFFVPEYADRSLGTFAILEQIRRAEQMKKEFVYLGYQIDDCRKMNYKSNFYPHERHQGGAWKHFSR